MRILHKIGLRASEEDVLRLAKIAIPASIGEILFEIDESSPHWPDIKSMIRGREVFESVRTEFTADEIKSAHWLKLFPTWHHGYPQPEDSYVQETYSSDGHCRRCGIVPSQVAPFRMRAEPKWGRRSVMQLNWIFDEFFVHREVWDQKFAPLGFAALEVIHHKTGRPLETVVQWDLRSSDQAVLQMSDSTATYCEACERPKYLPHVRGCFPSFTHRRTPLATVYRSAQWFGSGASARRAILISQQVRKALGGEDVRGWGHYPVCEG